MLEKTVGRRDFLKVAALTGATVALAGCEGGSEESNPAYRFEQIKSIYQIAVAQLGREHDFNKAWDIRAGTKELINMPYGDIVVQVFPPQDPKTKQRLAKSILEEQECPQVYESGSDHIPHLDLYWGNACGVAIYAGDETALVISIKEAEKYNYIRVPYPGKQSEAELLKFTDGTYKFDWTLLKWMRLKNGKIQIYQIIDKVRYEKNKPTRSFDRVSEAWVDLP